MFARVRTRLTVAIGGVASGRKVGGYVSRADYERLVRVSETGDVPISMLLRRALAECLPRWELALQRDRGALLTAQKETR